MNTSQHPVEQTELMAFLDGELPAERAAAVAAHIQQCGECRVAIAESRDLAERLGAWQVAPAPASLTEQVTSAAAGELSPTKQQTAVPFPQRRSRSSFPKWVWATAIGVPLIFLIAIGLTPNLMRSPMAVRQHSRIGAMSQVADVASIPAPPGVAGSLPGVPWGQGAIPAFDKAGRPGGGGEAVPIATAPMIARTASLKLLTKDFDKTREALEVVIRRHRGYSAQLTVSSESGSAHTLSATFRVPADQFDATIAEIKQLAHVEQESQGGEEVTDQYVDLQARLSNAQRTEQTVLELLQKRTGELSDVLAVEQELARVREQIERMEAELKGLQNRVAFATLQVELGEEYKAQLEMPHSLGGRLRNTLVEGFRTATDSLVSVLMFLLSVGPFLLLWALILFFPVRYVWRRVRARQVDKQA
jgi:anti-sigma factor RsiW